MSWRWNARRLLISAFLVMHLGATTIWVLPSCALKQRFQPTAGYYILPLGLWQFWSMFAPDPVRETVMLEAEVIDAKGLRHLFAFPRLADYSTWQGIPRFRFSKYAANLASDESVLAREFAARHAVRRLKLPTDAFPVDVHLLYQVRPTPPVGEPPADPMTPTQPMTLATYQFALSPEVQP